jgi:aryl-alcohol dehydrogenase-like predicted oxidoreductase
MDLSTWQGMRTRDPRRLTLGSAQWGMPYGIANQHGEPNASELEAMLARAKASGVCTIDTARAYGESEARIGRAISSREGWRVITKLGSDVHREGLGIAETLEGVAKSLAASRRALATNALPVLVLHRFAHRHACGGRLWRALLAERDAGQIGALGVSAATPEEAWAALEDPDIEVLQVASSLLDLRLHRQGFFPRARELGRTVYVHSIFLQGVAHLEPETLPPSLSDLVAPMQAIRSCASRVGVAPRALYLAFARELPGVHPILGCETDAQLDTLLADWASDAIDAPTMTLLVESLPTLEADAIDPSRWNSAEIDRKNRTGAASVATIST